LPAFRVAGRGFAVIQKDRVHAFVSIPEPNVLAMVAEDPETFAPVRRNEKIIAVEVELRRIPSTRLGELLELAWRHNAPRQLVVSHSTGILRRG
jgi:hypothetical protein